MRRALALPLALSLAAAVLSGLAPAAAQAPAAASPLPLWETVVGGVAGQKDNPLALAVDSTYGQVVVAGYGDRLATNDTDYDYLSVRLAGATGAVQGTTFVASPGIAPTGGPDYGRAVVIDARRGRTIVTGTSAGNGTGTGIATVAYNRSGAILWTARYDIGVESNIRLALDPATGIVYVTGSVGTAGGPEGILLAYGPKGKRLSSVELETTGTDVGVLPDGSAVVTGHTAGGIRTAAYRSSGSLVWAATYDGAQAAELAVDPRSGDVFVATDATGTGAVLSYTATGMLRWASHSDAQTFTAHRNIAVTPSGRVYLAGLDTDFDDAYHVTELFSSTGQSLGSQSVFAGNIAPALTDIAVDPDTGYAYLLGDVDGGSSFATHIRLLVYDGLQLRQAVTYRGQPTESARALVIDSSRNRVVISARSAPGSLSSQYDFLTVAYRTLP